jgi:hypothetical protein
VARSCPEARYRLGSVPERGVEDIGSTAGVAERIERAMIVPFEVEGHEAVVTTRSAPIEEWRTT